MNEPRQYRSPYREITAMQWRGRQDCEAVFAFLGLPHEDEGQDHTEIDVPASDGGVIVAYPGDWVLRDTDGFAVFAGDFLGAYEPVPDGTLGQSRWRAADRALAERNRIEREVREQVSAEILAAKGTDPRFPEGWASTADRDHAAKVARGEA